MQLAPRSYADVTVATPGGRIDHRSAAELEAALAPLLDAAIARRGALVLDFAGVDYISSVGLRVLMLAARRMREAQAPLALAALQTVVAEIFTISRFDKVLAVHPSVDAALAALSADAHAAWRSGGAA